MAADTWERLHRLRVAWFVTMGGFVLIGLFNYRDNVRLLEAVLRKLQLTPSWVPAFVLPFLLPNLEVARRLRGFRCPMCHGKFMGPWSGKGLFRRACAECGAVPGAAVQPAV
jgi:hypothetical protein